MPDSTLTEYVERKAFWRCGVCEREIKQQFTGRDTEPHVCSGTTTDGQVSTHQPTIMRYVEQEKVYPSIAAWALLATFDKSDWGLVQQAVEHYAKNRRAGARKRPGVENVMRGVFERFDAIQRACRYLKGGAPREYRIGGSNVVFAENADAALRSALLDARDEARRIRRDYFARYMDSEQARAVLDEFVEQIEAAADGTVPALNGEAIL